MYPISVQKAPFGVNLIGHVSGNLGLGVLARHLADLLLTRGCPLAILDVDPNLGRGGHDHRFAAHTVRAVEELRHPVTLLVFPPLSIVDFLRDPRHRHLLLEPDGLNVGLLNWEQSVVPAEWAGVLAGLDVAIAPSHFTRGTFERALPDVPVLSLDVPLPPPRDIVPDRARFGLDPDRVWFGTSFEPQSDIARKNPYAVLEAFDLLSRTHADVGLLIKVNNGIIDGRPHQVLEELRARTRANPRISLLESTLDYESVLTLYASLDVFVSLHRSEGIGLALMEAMALGKPVIATGWSGNMSFMDRSSACIVSHTMVPVRTDTQVYSQQLLGSAALWAEADVTHAADWMRVLARDAAVRTAFGRRAAVAMHRYQAQAREAYFLEELRAIWEAEVVLGIGRAQRTARRDRLRQGLSVPGRRFSRLPTRLLHAGSRIARWWLDRRLHHIHQL